MTLEEFEFKFAVYRALFVSLILIWVAVFLIGAVLPGCSVTRMENANHLSQRKVYNAWKMANPSVTNLTYSDWNTLFEKELLPGQIKRKNSDDLIIGMAIGTSIGAAANSGRR